MELTDEQKAARREARLQQARQLARAVPEALGDEAVPAQVLQAFGLMIEALLEEAS